MTGIWEDTFAAEELIWGLEPSQCAQLAAEQFAARGVRDVGEHRFAVHDGIAIYFYDEAAVRREFAACVSIDVETVAEPWQDGTYPFLLALGTGA